MVLCVHVANVIDGAVCSCSNVIDGAVCSCLVYQCYIYRVECFLLRKIT